MKNILDNADVLGEAIYDFHCTGKNKRIKVHSNITEGEYIDSAYLFRNFNQMPKLERTALALCKGKILDVGACAGAHSLYLQNSGKDVTALEQSALCCKVMHERKISKVEHTRFEQYTGEPFDTILLLMNGIGISGQLSKLEPFLLHCKSLLANGGKIIFDSSDISYMFEEVDGSMWLDLNTEYYGELNYQFEYKQKKSETFDWLFLDFEMAKVFAGRLGFQLNLIESGDHFDYLASLSI